jgi:predicted small secreted protein
MSSKRLLIAASCLALAGCNTVDKNIGQEDPYLGEAVRYNAAVQTINPDPVYAADAAQPGDNGKKGADAVKRYRNDQVNQRHRTESRQNSALSTTTGPE